MYYEGEGVPQDYAEAARWYRLAAEQGNADAQDILGLMYANGAGVAEDAAEALRWWREAAEQGHALAQTKVAWVLLEQGLPDEAIEAARQAIRLDPNLAVAHDAICGILASQGQIEGAITACTRALELDPENTDILNNFAWLLVTAEDPRLRDPQKGLLLAQRAVEANSGQDAAILDTLGEAYFANGRFDEAVDVQRKAIALEPQNEALQQKLHKFEQARLAEAQD
jgi:TPR repeat protein